MISYTFVGMKPIGVISLTSFQQIDLENWTNDFSEIAFRFSASDGIEFRIPSISVTYVRHRVRSVFRTGKVLSKLRLTSVAASEILRSKGRRGIQRNAMYLTFEQVECLADHYSTEILKSFNKAQKSKSTLAGDDFALYQAFNYAINWKARSLEEIVLDKESILNWFWACISDRLGEFNQTAARVFQEKIHEISEKHNRISARFSSISFDVGILLAHIRPHQFHIFPSEDNSSNTTHCIPSWYRNTFSSSFFNF